MHFTLSIITYKLFQPYDYCMNTNYYCNQMQTLNIHIYICIYMYMCIYIYIYIYIFVYYLSASSLCCSMQDLFVSCTIFLVVHGLSNCSAQAQLPHDMWDLISPTSDQTHVLYIARWILNNWTTKEVENVDFLLLLLYIYCHIGKIFSVSKYTPSLQQC